MRLLLDTHVALALVWNDLERFGAAMAAAIGSNQNSRSVSAASLWEIALKHRLGKLDLPIPLDAVANYLEATGIDLLDIDHRHAVEELRTPLVTRDPFDQLLVAQCQVENFALVTVDRALVDHPLAWRGA